MKRYLAGLTIAVLLSALIPQSQAATKIDLNAPELGLNINESFKYVSSPPVMYAVSGNMSDPLFTFCASLTDKPCVDAPNINIVAHLAPCDGTITVNCISSIYAKNESGQITEGKFLKYAAENSKWSFEQDVARNLPQIKGQGGIWQIPGLTHGGGTDTYFVDALTNSWMSKSAGSPVGNERFSINSLDAAISPVIDVVGSYTKSFASDSSNKSSDGSISGGVGASVNQDQAAEGCIMMEDGHCFKTQDAPSGYRFGMKIILGNKLNGWFHGRIYRPEINVSTGAGGSQVIAVEALPVVVPTVTLKVPTSTITQELRTYLSQDKRFSNGSGYLMPGNAGQDAIDHVALWLPIIKDKATSSRMYWDVKTLLWDPSLNQTVGVCSSSTSEVSGVVTTNALAYSAGPPTFNKSDQSLDYKVVSPHYTAKNELAIGTYDLAIRSDVARCIYGFSKAPISGSISIINDSGQTNVATTIVNEKNGWLYLSANGFTYSSPTVRVKLAQAPEPEPTPTATPTASPTPISSKAPAKKTTITCVKGKMKKKVTGVNPKCPSGFKKAA